MKCPFCNGKGSILKAKIKCGVCKGAGEATPAKIAKHRKIIQNFIKGLSGLKRL